MAFHRVVLRTSPAPAPLSPVASRLAPDDYAPKVTIRLQVTDGRWETVGVDRFPEVDPESLSLSANDWGSDTATFVLRRRPADVHPDLRAFTPCEVSIDDALVWSGRVRETPTQDGEDPNIQVEGQGWQYHADDATYSKVYVKRGFDNCVPTRDIATWDVGQYVASNAETSIGASLTLATQEGSQSPPAGITAMSAIFDLGEWDAFQRVSLTVRGGNSNLAFGIYATDVPGARTEAFELSAQMLGPVVIELQCSRRFRYLEVQAGQQSLVQASSGSWIQVLGARFFYSSNSSYRIGTATTGVNSVAAGSESNLTASFVARDALALTCPLLSKQVDRVANTSFIIPQFITDGQKTAREVWQSVNALHLWRMQVDVDRKLVFQPPPAQAAFEVGAWGGAVFQAASENSAEDIYNEVIVEGTRENARREHISRTTGHQPLTAGEVEYQPTNLQPLNGNFTGTIANWTLSSGAVNVAIDLFLDTLRFHTTDGNVFSRFSGPRVSGAWPSGGTFRAGVQYRFKLEVASADNVRVRAGALDSADDYGVTVVPGQPGAPWRTEYVTWTPRINTPSNTVTMNIENWSANDAFAVDTQILINDVQVHRVLGSLPDRQGFKRTKLLPIENTFTEALANQLGDTYIAAHRTTPLRGSLTVTGRQAVRRVVGGATVHPSVLLTNTGERMRFSHRVDPDTGGQSRDGTINAVTYNHDEQTAEVTIDNTRENFEALLARLAVVSS